MRVIFGNASAVDIEFDAEGNPIGRQPLPGEYATEIELGESLLPAAQLATVQAVVQAHTSDGQPMWFECEDATLLAMLTATYGVSGERPEDWGKTPILKEG